MKKFAIIFSLISLSGCVTVARQNYDNALYNLRENSISTARRISNEMEAFLLDHTEDQAIEGSKQAVADMMKDPESAKFRNIRLVPHRNSKVMCGEINAKNAYGAYAGFEPFVSSPKSALVFRSDRRAEIQNAENAGISITCGL